MNNMTPAQRRRYEKLTKNAEQAELDISQVRSGIDRIRIKGKTGFFEMTRVNDELILTPDSVSYKGKSEDLQQTVFADPVPEEHHWTYRTDSAKYRKLYEKITDATYELLQHDFMDCDDGAVTELDVWMHTGEKVLKSFVGDDEELKEYLKLVRKVVPGTEEIPKMLK